MARMRITLVLLLALAAGGGLAFGTYNYMQNVPVKTVSMPTKPVVVAATDLDLGAELTADDLRVIDWPANAVPDGAFSTPDEVIGRGLVMPVIQNEPILPMKLASQGRGRRPAAVHSRRACAPCRCASTKSSASPATCCPARTSTSSPRRRPTNSDVDMTSKVVLTNVQVLAAGTKIERDTEKDKPMPVSVVTLLVSTRTRPSA